MEKIDSQGAAPVIPGFTPVRELGRGATAEVWLARRDRDRGLCAIKCLMSGPEAGPDVENDLRREVRVMSALSHRHLVRIHEIVRLADDAGGMGLVMDYAPGGSLGQLVAGRGKLSVGEAVTVLTPLAQVLAYLHNNGFVHGDLSPGNVLFTEHGKPLLADLGLAGMVGDGGSAAGTGTPGFVAPTAEDELGPTLRPDRDVFALAALGWFGLTGSAPDTGQRRPPLSVLVPEVPPQLAAALEAGLNPEPGQRPTAAEFAALVFRSAEAEPVDLSASVHPSVLPRLLTRRDALGSRRRKRRTFAGRGHRGHRGTWPALGNLFHRPGQPAGGHAPMIRGRLLLTFSLAVALAAGLGVLTVGTTSMVSSWPFLKSDAPGDLPDPSGTARATEHDVQPLSEGAGPTVRIEDRTRSEDPVEAIHALAELRSMALSSGSEENLGEVNVSGSSAAKTDLEALAALRSAGVVLEGFTTTLRDVVAMPPEGRGQAVVRLRAETSTYRERDASGGVLATRAASPPRELQIVLLRTAEGWRISEIQAAVH